jgi:hypothetical protein
MRRLFTVTQLPALFAAAIALVPGVAFAGCTDPTTLSPRADPTKQHDSTAAIQAAVNTGWACIPPGKYLVSAPITITQNGTVVQTAGKDSTILFPSQDGDVFTISLPTPASYLDGVQFNGGLRIYTTANPTSGAAFHLIGVQFAVINDALVTGTYGGVWCQSCLNANINVDVIGNNSTEGSFGYLFDNEGYAEAPDNSEIWVRSDDRGQSNMGLTYPVFVRNSDGITFTGHFGFSSGPAITLMPASNTTHLTGIEVQGAVDTAPIGVYIAAPASMSAQFGAINLSRMTAILTPQASVYVDPSANNLSILNMLGMELNGGAASPIIYVGSRITYSLVQ